MAFDVDGAIKAGYKIDEIADHLGKKAGFDVGAARQSGYSDDEIVEYLRAGKPAKTPQQKTAKAEPPQVAYPSIEDSTTSAPTPERRSTEVINPEWRNAPKQSLISRGLNAAKRALSPYDTTETMSPADIASAQIARETGKGWSTVVDPARRIEKGFAPIPRLAAAGLKQSEGGAIRGIAEMKPNVRSAYLGPVAGPLSMLVPQKAWQKIGEAGQSYANEGVREHQKVKEEYPVEIGTPESMMQTAGQSMLEQAVPMAASVVTGNPAPALLAMSGMTAARDYHGFRERGHSPEVAAIASTATGAIEGATELLPVGAFLKLAGGKQALVKSLVGLYGSEIPGEMIATVTQDMIDKSMVRPDMTVGEMGQEIKKYFTSGEAALMQKETIGSAGIQTTLMGMAGSTPRILSRAANRINGTDPITQGMTISSPAASGMPQLTEEQAARRNKLSGIMENDTEADAQARLQAIEARKRGEVSQGAEGTSSTVPESEQVAAEPVDMTEPVAPAEPEKEVQQSGKKDLSSLEARHAKLKVKIFDEEGNQREGVSQKAIDNYNALTATIESQRAEHAKPAIRPEASGLTGADASVMDGFTKTSMKAPVPPSSNVEAGEDEQHFRVVPAKTPLGEVQDHWTTTKIDDARQIKQSLEESNGEPYQIVEIDGQAVEAAGGKSKGKSPYGTGANWVKTDKTVTPDAVVGVVDSDDVKTKVMNRIDGILPETSPSGHPQTKQHLADVINSEELPGGNVTVADIEAAGRNIKANGAPQTDIERALVRVLADDVRSNRHKYEVKTQGEQSDIQPREAAEEETQVGKQRKDTRKQRVDEFKKKYGYAPTEKPTHVSLPAGWKMEVGKTRTKEGHTFEAEVDWHGKRLVFSEQKHMDNPEIVNHEVAHVIIETLPEAKREALFDEYIKAAGLDEWTVKNNFHHEEIAMDYGDYLTNPDSAPKELKAVFDKHLGGEKAPEKKQNSYDENVDKVVYHASKEDFETFDKSKIGSFTGENFFGKGFSFADTKDTIAPYGTPRKFRIQGKFFKAADENDFRKYNSAITKRQDEIAKELIAGGMDAVKAVRESRAQAITEVLKAAGYDGVIGYNRILQQNEYTVFEPESISKAVESGNEPSPISPETRRKNLETQLAVSRHPKDRERIQKALEKLKGKTRAISEVKRAKQERDDRAADAENQVRLQKLGQEHVPGVRAQDAAEAGRMWEMKENGDVSAQEWYDYVADLVASNKVAKAADPNIGREWDSPYGRQRIVSRDTTGPNPLYDVLTVETGAIRRYDASRIEDIVKKDEHHLTPEYEAEQKEQKESARLRAERDARQAEKDKQIADEIAAFTAGMSNMAAGKAKAALLKQIRFSNGVMTRKKYVEERIAEGHTVTGEGSERRLEDADGVGLGEKKLSKTGMDYAEFLLGRKEAEYGSQQGKPEEETKVRQLVKDIRKQRVEEFKKKYGYAEDTEKTASQNAPENPAKTPATPKAISEMKNLSSEDLDAIFEEESEKSVESQTAEEDAFTFTPYEATPYNRLLETLVAHGEPGRIKKEEGDGFTTTSYTVTIPNAKVSRFIDDVTEDGFVWVDDEYDEDHDTKTLTLEFNQRMTAPVKPPPAPEVKQSGEEKFRAIQRKHLEKQLAIARTVSEKEKLEKALARLKGRKQGTAAKTGEKPAIDNREEPYFKKGERVQLSYDGSHGEVFESSTMIMKSFTIGRRGVEGDTREYVHSYRVKKDNGVITLASFSEMQHEISPAPEVVPAPVVPPKGEAMEPDRLLTQISNTRGYAKNRRAAATRARKQEKKDAYRREAEQYDKEADELQAVLDAWAEKYPKEAAKVLPPKQGSPEAKQAQQNADTGMTFHETKHTKYGHDLFVVSLDERVEMAEYQRLKREAEALGGHYSSFKGRGAIPGFQFREKAKAEQFMREQGGVKAKAPEAQKNFVKEAEDLARQYKADGKTRTDFISNAPDELGWTWETGSGTVTSSSLTDFARDAFEKAGYDRPGSIAEVWDKANGVDRAPATVKFEIGDHVEPIRDRDVLKPGVVQHVQTDRDGNQYIQVGSRHWNAADFKKVEAGQAGKPSEQAEQVKESPEQTKTASDILQAAAAEGFRGMEEAAKGLHELFGGASLKFGLGGIDEETYAKAKPHFQAALNSVIEAGKGVREFFRFLIDNFGAEIKPYVMRFVEDIKNGPQGDSREERGREVSEVGDEGVQSSEQNGEHAGRPGTGADAGVLEVSPSEDVGATSEDGDSEGAGARPGREVSGVNQEIHGSGNVLDGRDGTSRTGVATSGTGKRGGGTGRRRNVTVPGTNYHINNPDKLIGGTPKVRFAKNKAAIEAYQSVTSEGRQPTPEELDAMAAYTGWGSFGQELFKGSWEHPMPKPEWEKESNWLRAHLGEQAWKSAQNSIINAHYTDPPTVMAMWEIARRLGFKGGRVLEPSMGIGNFFGLMPADIAEKCKLAGIELDDLTGGMAKLLYPQANIQIMGYQDSKTADNFYDLVIGNWPFAKDGPADRRYRQISPSLHDYFFLKALDQVRPGGFVIGVTSSGTMDKIGKLTRLELAKKGDLIAAFRLPSGAFEQYAGTSVVTDIIVLQKRETPNVNPQDAGWINVSETEVANGVINTNEYWAAHPKHVLGVMDFGHGTTRGRPGMIVNRPENFASLLKGIVKKVPENIYNERAQTEKVISYITNNTKDRQQSVTFGPDGGLYVVQGEYLAPLHEVHRYKVEDKKETARREKQIGKLVEIRKAYGALIDVERAGSEETDSLRKDLAAKYDAFVKAHGDINKSYGLDVLRRVGDPFYPVLAALEMGQKNADGSVTYRGAKVLRESTMRAKRTIENPTVEDAYVLSRNESLSLDMNRIAELSGMAVEDVTKELLDNGTIYLTPAGNYEASDVYLSGNVRLKLREAEAAQADGMDMARNIEELKKIIPPDQPYYKIETKLGSPWVKVEHYQQFVAGMLNEQNLDGIDIYFHLGTWKVKFTDRSLNHKPEATTVWGHKDYPFNKLFQSAMNNAAVTIRTKDEDGNIIVDRVATEEVNDKIERIREEFTSWVWKDTARKFEVEKEYNELMNAVADTKFDGSFLTFAGMSLAKGESPFSLRKHQSDAIWRGLVNQAGLYAHEVGTGKTFTIGGLAVESRRYGIAKKPLIFVHNANSASVAEEVQSMYPAAKVLYVDNLAPDKIDVTMRQIANDDWDAVIVPHSLINRFALTRETLMTIAAEEIAAMEQEAIEAAEEDGESLSVEDLDDEDAIKSLRSVTAKELVHARNRIIKKIDEMAMRASRENAVSFEQLGVDMIIVDEAHQFKKPPITTKMRMKGLNKGTSGQSLALHLLTTYVKSLNAGKGVHLFTGTPITNTLTEIYHMQRYIMGDEMARVGVKAWDPWFGSFADSVGDVELTAAGDYEATTRLAAIVNAPELRRMIGQYMDIVFADDMPEFKPRTTSTGKTTKDKDLSPEERAELSTGRSENPQGRPYKKVITETCPMGRQQERILQGLKDLALHFRNASPRDRKDMIKSGHPASPVLVETAAANAGLDVRLVNKDAEYEPEGKVGKCIENLLKIYKEHDKATQVIFMERGFSDRSTSTKTHRDGTKTRTVKERFNLAKFLVDALVEGGIPREEIAIVDGKTSREKRKEIADAMNLCKVRVVIGNTQTLGTGVNMQENLRAIHHLDAPWMPGEMEQRNGRGWRQGNKWNTVLEIRYVTEGLDGRRWQVLVIKDRFIKSFLKGNDDTRVIEGDVMSAEEDNDLLKTLSEAAGDPRILLREKYRKDIEKLQRRQRVHEWGIMDAESAIARTMQDIKQIGIRRDILKQIIDHYEGNKGDSFSFTLGKETYTERKKAQTALDKRLLKLGKFADHEKIGEIYGFDITARWSQFNDQYEIRLALPGVTDVTTNGDNRQSLSYIRDLLDAKPSVASMEAILRNLHKHFDLLSDRRTSLEESLKSLEVAAKETFPRAADLAKKEELLRNLMADMEANPVPPPSWLRNGAPAGGEVYVDGKAHVVAGHKWSNDGYFVKIEKGEGTEDIPYLAVTDENGEAVYAEREFTPPVIPRATQQQQNSDPAATPSDNERRFHKTRAVSGTKASDVKEVVAPLLSKWRNAPKVVVVQSESDLPANEIADIASKNAQGEIGGIFTKDIIYLIADNIARKEDAVKTLLHEMVGHYGVRGLMGRKFNSLLQDVYYLYGEKGLRDIANRYDLDLSNPDDRLIAAEEKLAELAESGEKPGLIRRAIAMIRGWLKSIGVDISLSDNDVKAIILRAARGVERGLEDGRDDKGATPRYSRRNRTGDPATDAVLDKIGRPDKTIMERIRDIIKERAPLRVEQGLFDQFASIKQYDETAYIMTRMTTGFSDTFMAMLEHGAPIWANGWVKVDSRDNGIMKIFEPVAEDLDLFLGWMVGERAQKLMNEGRENYFTQAEINKLKALKTPENAVRWENVRINYVQYKKKVLDFAEQAGVINSEARKVWDHEEYVPFYRITEEANGTSKVQGPRGKRGIASQHSGIRTLKGGTSQLGDVFENILQNFSHLVHASIKNRAATEALRAAEAAGAASTVKWDWKAAHIETKQIVKKIREELGADDILEDEEDQLDDFLTLFYLARPKGTAIVHYLEDGKPKYYEVHDDLLLRSLTNINSQPFQGYFMDLARMTKRLMTVGITSMPGFMVRNIARDTVHVAAISGTNFIPVVSSMQGFMKAFREDDDMMQLMAAGGSFHGGWAYGHDMKKAADHAKHLMRKKGVNSGVIDSIAKLWDAYQKVGSAMENAARVKVYDLELRDTGDHLRAAYKAKDLMDFSLHGDWKAVKFLCETVIFLQARIQSLHRLGRAAWIKQQLKSMAVVGTSIALASVLLYLFNRDDDRYKELEEWDKDTFWHFWIGEHHFRFPKPFEVGALFGTMAERITELAIEEAHDGKLFASRLYHMLTQTFALGLPHVGSELYQQAANKDSFTGRPIVNSRLKGMLPEDQKEPWTSETAIAMAKVPGPSLMGPKRLEHFIEGYTGTLGAFVMGCSDMIIRKSMGYPDRPAMTPAEYPIVGSFYRGKDDRGRNTKYVTEFYNLMNEVDETYRSVQGARQLGNAERYEEIVSDEKQRDLLNIKKPLDKRRKDFTDINRETRRIYADREMTPKQKRKRLNELTWIKNDIAKDTIRRIEAAGISIPR